MVPAVGGEVALEQMVADQFRNFLNNLRTTNDKVINTRRQGIVRRINQAFRRIDTDEAHYRYEGSYGRGTAIKGFIDVDLLVVLPYEVFERYTTYAGNGQLALLESVREALRQQYTAAVLSTDGHAIMVPFADGLSFEVVPSFINKDGKTYTYPDPTAGGSWKTKDPVGELEAINVANNLYNRRLKHLCRMAKAWRMQQRIVMDGLLIDTLAYQFMLYWRPGPDLFVDYDAMMAGFLRFLSERDHAQAYWMAPGSNREVWRQGSAFEGRAAEAYAVAQEAMAYGAEGETDRAVASWRSILGPFFTG